MARMTASDLVSFVRKGMGNPSTDEWTDTELLRLINLAQVDVATTHKPPELITSTTISAVANTYDYELTATDVLEITEARNDTTGLRLKKSCMEDWVRDNQDATLQTGDVLRWLEFGVGANYRPNIRLWMVPDSSSTIRFYYIKKPTELVTSPAATSSILREQWDEFIMQTAIEKGLAIDQQRQNAAAARQMNQMVEGRAAGRSEGAERKFVTEARVAPETRTRYGR